MVERDDMGKEALRAEQEATGQELCEAMDIDFLRDLAVNGGPSRVRTAWRGVVERVLNGKAPSQESLDMGLIWASSVPLETWRIPGLLAAGASLAAKKAKGWRSPLLMATRAGNCEAINLLLEAGADVDEIDAHGDTALSWAACNRLAALKILASRGKSSHGLRDAQGLTPAMLAIGHGDADGECLRLLLPLANLAEHAEEMADWAKAVMQDPEPVLLAIQKEQGRRLAVAEANDLLAHVKLPQERVGVKKSNHL